jgi:phage replication-related protein YjqB (UPF0714/DUF867 family)
VVFVADKFPNFAALAREKRSGIDWDVHVRRAQTAFAIVAPHGGGIEAGTSELADAVADTTHSFYTFEGLQASGNHELHITSTRFDEPMCLSLIGVSDVVVTLHGEHTEADGEGVFMGGLDADLGDRIRKVLNDHGFTVRTHPDPNLQGREPGNICNRGLSDAGVQLELSKSVRETMFESLNRAGRKKTTKQFDNFVSALRKVLGT